MLQLLLLFSLHVLAMLVRQWSLHALSAIAHDWRSLNRVLMWAQRALCKGYLQSVAHAAVQAARASGARP
jgi:hypothetical protein